MLATYYSPIALGKYRKPCSVTGGVKTLTGSASATSTRRLKLINLHGINQTTLSTSCSNRKRYGDLVRVDYRIIIMIYNMRVKWVVFQQD